MQVNQSYPDFMSSLFRQKEPKYRKQFKSIDDGFCIVKVLFDKMNNPVDFRFLEINQTFEKQSGLIEALGKTMRELKPDLESYWFEIFGKVALTGEAIRFEQTAKAMKRFFDVLAFPFGDPGKRHIAVLFKDITPFKEKEYSDAWLKTIIQSSDDAIVSKNLEGVITSWNSGAEQLFGYTAKEAVGENITLIIPEERLQEETVILNQIKNGERIENLETVRTHKNGSLLDISLTVSPIMKSGGEIIGASKIARDISKHKQTEAELKLLNNTLDKKVEERTEVLQSYQHKLRSLTSKLTRSEEEVRNRLATELHNNLGQILAVANLKLSFIDSSKLSEATANEISELSELMNEALTYTKEMMFDLKPPPALNKEDFSEVLGWISKRMEKFNLEVTLNDDGQPKPLNKEVRLTLQQCIQELLNNVVKHSGVKKSHITLAREQDLVLIKVEDKGRGFDIGKEQIDCVDQEGFGLFNIFEQMEYIGGNFEVISEPDKGTTAILKIPLEKQFYIFEPGTDKEIQGLSSDKPAQLNLFRPVKVMLVDDHTMVRRGLREMIDKENDMKVIAEAVNGNEAVKLARETSPDIIIMDVNLPGMDGIEATQKISVEHSHVRIIGLSLHRREEVSRNMINAGATAYLSKDEAFETLCTLIRREASLLLQNHQ